MITTSQAYTIKINLFLKEQGFILRDLHGYYSFYDSPKTPNDNGSFVVNVKYNYWYDFSTDRGGSIIDLASYLYGKGTREQLLKQLYEHTKYSRINLRTHMKYFNACIPKAQLQNISLTPINSPSLRSFLSIKNIDLDVANHYCQEIHFAYKDIMDQGLAIRNEANGWQVLTPLLNTSIIHDDVTHIKAKPLNASKAINTTTCHVFLDIISTLQYISNKHKAICEPFQDDILIINKITNIRKVKEIIRIYPNVITHFPENRLCSLISESITSNKTQTQ